MKKTVLLSFLCVVLGLSYCSRDETQVKTKTNLKTENEKLSYTLGIKYGLELKKEGVEIDWPAFTAGMQHKLYDNEILLTNEEIIEMNGKLNKAKIAKRQQDEAEAKERNTQFLEENKTKPGVITTESGLQYKILEQGDGPKPGQTDKVSAHYIGELIDGTEFDNSYTRGQPAQFPLNRVIKGWSEALQLMPVGSRYKLYIPAELGYGARRTSRIPAHSTLIFEVELLDIIESESEEQ